MRIHIVGAGRIVEMFHLPALLRHVDTEQVSVSDISLDRCKFLASKFGVAVIPQLSASDTADLVLIAVPPHARHDAIRQVLNFCKYIVVEKPAAFSLPEYTTLLAGLGSRASDVYVAHNRRYFPNMHALRALMFNDTLTEDVEIKIFEGGSMTWLPYTNHMGGAMRSDDKGVLQDVGSHLIDSLEYVFGTRVLREGRVSLIHVDDGHYPNSLELQVRGHSFSVDIGMSRAALLSNLLSVQTKNRVIFTRSLWADSLEVISESGHLRLDCTDGTHGSGVQASFACLWEDVIYKGLEASRLQTIEGYHAHCEFLTSVIDQIEASS